MYSKQDIENTIYNEFRIIKHLAEKIPADKHHHKPTEKQRTTIELLQYISRMGKGMLAMLISGDMASFGSYTEESKNVTVENFAEALDKEQEEMKKLFEQLTDEELRKEVSLFGTTAPRSAFLLNLLMMASAYKMQLFLYIKQSGVENIGTSNAWGGMDMPTKA